jgi:hypothetical protein
MAILDRQLSRVEVSRPPYSPGAIRDCGESGKLYHKERRKNMYRAMIDADMQQFKIIDDECNLIATRSMPFQEWPNPGRDFLMAQRENQDAYDKILALVEAANAGGE